MKNRYVLYLRGKTYYGEDRTTGKQFSLRTKDPKLAKEIIEGKNKAAREPHLQGAVARATLAVLEPQLFTRTWQDAVNVFSQTGKKESSRLRKVRALARPAFDLIRNKRLADTTPEDFYAVLNMGGSMVHQYLKCLQSIACGHGWLVKPVLWPKQWPARKKLPKRRAITREEHEKILLSEKNQERRAYYEIIWETGAAQSDGANFGAHNIDWSRKQFSYVRMKTGERATIQIGPRFEALLRSLPTAGFLFPNIQKLNDKWRAAEFSRRRKVAAVSKEVSLHSYRYAWAQRARANGYPRRWAEAALGHNCPAVHEAYANDDSIVCPSLEEYENRIIALSPVFAEAVDHSEQRTVKA